MPRVIAACTGRVSPAAARRLADPGAIGYAAAMAEHPNATRIRALFAAFRAGDVAAIQDAIAPDATWHFPGRRGRLAGSHAGHDAIFAFLGHVVALTEGTFGLDLEAVLADDDHGVVFFRGHGTRPDGRTLDNPTCLRIRFAGGRAVEIHEFVWDLEHVESFWAA